MKEITIIEDDRITQFLLKTLLLKEGYIVNCVMDGKEILEKKSLFSVDLVILDIMMPNMYDSAKLISVYQNITAPIIVMSSMDKSDGIYFTKKINAESYFTKPLDHRDIINEVNDILSSVNI